MKKGNLIMFFKITFMFLLLIPILLINHSFASECMKCEEKSDGLSNCSPCAFTATPSTKPEKSEVLSQGDSVFSPEVTKFIEGTKLSHASKFPDPNESVEALKAYLNETGKIEKAIKKRFFDEPIDTGGLTIAAWLEESEKRLLSVKEKHPESRHISEVLGSIYRELYEHTGKREYLTKAVEAFIYAERMGIKHAAGLRRSHYVEIIAEILTKLGDRERLNKFFSEVLEAYPIDYLANLHYAKALSKFNDRRADDLFKNAMSLEPDGPFDSAISYTDHLLDGGKYQEALNILNKIVQPHQSYHFTHFLKGYTFEKLGRTEEAKKEYNQSEKLRGGVFERFNRPPAKYKIPGSKLQKDIKFQDEIVDKKHEEVQIKPLDLRTTPCSSTDWACKAYWYGIWTIDGEARGGTVGMHRAVGWNIRTRVFSLRGQISCFGSTETCFNYAWRYPIVQGDVESLHKRYFYVIETGGYAGLTKYSSVTEMAKKAGEDVYYGRVPDPIVRACYTGTIISGNQCTGTCSIPAGIWGSFWASQGGVEFRAGKLEYCNGCGTYPAWFSCYQFTPTSTPSGAFCGKDCFTNKGVICPIESTVTERYCHNSGQSWYYYTGPTYGNFFWSFNK